MSEKPKYNLFRTGDDIEIVISNRDDRETVIYRSDQHNRSITQHATITADTFNETLAAGLNAGYVLRFKDIEVSIFIIQDNTDETPPWYLVGNRTGVTFTATTEVFTFDWGTAVEVDTFIVDNLKEGTKSIRKYTTE